MRLDPFRALYATPKQADEVIAPPYDVISTGEARELAEGYPRSFLHVVRPEIDLDAGLDPDSEAGSARAHEIGGRALAELEASGALQRDDTPALWIYRLDHRVHGVDHAQTAVLGGARVQDYIEGRIKCHEHTRRPKEDERTRHIESLQAHTGLVYLTCRANAELVQRQRAITERAPDIDATLDFSGDHPVRHRLWRVTDPEELRGLREALDALDAFYVADGHHRAAGAVRVAQARRERDPEAGAEAPWERFPAVIFPHDELWILGYHRVVADLGQHDEASFLEALGEVFEIGEPGAHDAEPPERHVFGLYLNGRWRRLWAKPGVVDEDDEIDRLDVALLQNRVLEPILGIGDPRADDRLDFVGGIRGTGELERRVDAQGGGCAFAMHGTTIEELLAVADAGRVMPPKSTWFEPKLASGLITHPIDAD